MLLVFDKAISSVQIFSLISCTSGSSERTHESSVLFSSSWQIGHVFLFIFLQIHIGYSVLNIMYALLRTIALYMGSNMYVRTAISLQAFCPYRCCTPQVNLQTMCFPCQVGDQNPLQYYPLGPLVLRRIAVSKQNKTHKTRKTSICFNQTDLLILAGSQNLYMRLECLEYTNKLLQVQEIITLDLLRGWIHFNASYLNGGLPQHRGVGALADCKYQLVSIRIQTFTGSVSIREQDYISHVK